MPKRRSLSRSTTPFLLLALLPLLACGKDEDAAGGGGGGAPGGGGEMPPAQVTVVTLKTEPVTLTRELPGRITPVPGGRGAAAGQRHRRAAAVHRGRPGQGRPAALPARRRRLPRRVRERPRRARQGRGGGACGAADRQAQPTSCARSTPSASRRTRTPSPPCAQAEADVAAGRAMVERAPASTCGYARITSPITGRIGKSTVTPGALVTANQADPLATVQQLDPIYVDVTQSSSELLRLRRELAGGGVAAGDAATPVTHPARGRQPLRPRRASSQFTDVTVDRGHRQLRAARRSCPTPSTCCCPACTSRAVLGDGAATPDALLVPQQGVTRDPKGNATAMVVGTDGKVERRAR